MKDKTSISPALHGAKLLVRMRNALHAAAQKEIQSHLSSEARILETLRYDLDSHIRDATRKVIQELLGDTYRSVPTKGKLTEALHTYVHDAAASYILKHLPERTVIEPLVKEAVDAAIRRHVVTLASNAAEQYVASIFSGSRYMQQLKDLAKEAEREVAAEDAEVTNTTED